MVTVTTNASATAMAEEIFGAGVTIVDADYTGWSQSSGIYSNGDTLSPGVAPGDTGVILSTGRASRFRNNSGEANQRPNTSTNTPGQNNDPQFNAIAGGSTFDASYLEVDFIPTESTYSIQFVYASEEFPEFVGSNFNDIVAVWINGVAVNLAVGSGTANIGNINDNANQNLYNDNTGDQFNTEMDGFTVTLTLTLNVVPNMINSIKIGVADVGDSNYDTSLLIAGGSIQSDVLASDDAYTVVTNGTPELDVLANDTAASGAALTVTQINGVDVSVGDTVTLPLGQTVTLNADGTLSLVNTSSPDDFNFTYTITDGSGVEDVAFVQIDTVPCFVAGTKIQTPDGERDVETLQPGDLVDTLDNGPLPLKWIGRRTVPATDDYAPIAIAAGTFGKHGKLRVSPNHRILVRNHMSELLFGAGEVLIAAKDLVTGGRVRVDQSAPDVEYVHILFDDHQVVFSEGLATESFLPGPQVLNSFEHEVMEEICTLFPEIDPETGEGYGKSARHSLKSYEARVLVKAGLAA